MIIRLIELVGLAALQAYMRRGLGIFGFLQGKKNLGRITVGGFCGRSFEFQRKLNSCSG
jgi:hypothetical protein